MVVIEWQTWGSPKPCCPSTSRISRDAARLSRCGSHDAASTMRLSMRLWGGLEEPLTNETSPCPYSDNFVVPRFVVSVVVVRLPYAGARCHSSLIAWLTERVTAWDVARGAASVLDGSHPVQRQPNLAPQRSIAGTPFICLQLHSSTCDVVEERGGSVASSIHHPSGRNENPRRTEDMRRGQTQRRIPARRRQTRSGGTRTRKLEKHLTHPSGCTGPS